MKNGIKIFFALSIFVVFIGAIYGDSDGVIEEAAETLNLEDMINNLNQYVEETELSSEFDLGQISQNLMSGKSNNNSIFIKKIIDIFAGETINISKTVITILIIAVVTGIFSSLEIEKNGSVGKIVYLTSFVLIMTILVSMYAEVIKDYTKTINILSSIMQTITPFVTIVMIACGGIVSSNIIQPAILFVASLIGFFINYIVIPFVTIAIVLNTVSMMSDNIRLNKLGAIFSKSSLWITGVVFTLFLSIMSVKGSISTSVDSAVVKTTQTAVSNFVPVVGKFVSDSLESIMGATEIIGKTAGVIGIVVMVIVCTVPIIQLLVIFVSHKVLAAVCETIVDNKNIVGIIDSFADTYKVLLGVLIGVLALFVMSSGILIKLIGSIT